MNPHHSADVPSVLVIGGPTATGKSALALRIANELGGTIISADSVQVYSGFDIGSAKPSESERAMIPHRCIDVAEPHETFHAARWVTLADAAIHEANAQGRVPVIVGGTGLYIRSLIHGLSESPEVPPEVRAQLETELQTVGPVELHARLAQVDPVAAARIHPNDSLRVTRALEVFRFTGVAMSEHQRAHGLRQRRYRALYLVLTAGREVLRAAISVRTERMLRAGLVEETTSLLAAGVSADCSPMQSIGYRQVLDVMSGRMERRQLAEQISLATAQYAKRQRTWFRGQPEVRWLHAEAIPTSIALHVVQWLRGEREWVGADTEDLAMGTRD
ncbi:MAG: tRNA (adenosine(37)-N6)-dimethylallyltransferase MiaA [Myxococcales bacterium]|nr:tRNA (adenosine(37)-N6)-dimethylallyltransferase MiaA [Myxococcales bacterium]